MTQSRFADEDTLAHIVQLEAENARLREQLRCVRDNLSKGMSKSMQKLQAREIDAAIRGEA